MGVYFTPKGSFATPSLPLGKINDLENRVSALEQGGGSGVTIETPTGTVDGSNRTFTVSATPKWIIGDGIVYFENAGYTLSGLTVTMTSAPWSYIRAII